VTTTLRGSSLKGTCDGRRGCRTRQHRQCYWCSGCQGRNRDTSSTPFFSEEQGHKRATTTDLRSGNQLNVNPNGSNCVECKIVDADNGSRCQHFAVHVSWADQAVQPSTENIFPGGSFPFSRFFTPGMV